MSYEIASFLVPEVDPIQLSFFTLMTGLAVATIWSVKRSAHADRWENNWGGGSADDASDDLDAEHGSVTDISHAVATTAEKMADIMPGILLIFGLLGTFLGLGMALNKASSILMEANSAANGMDGAMNNLMGMMQGLGTKFKTSTWGIIAFLGLKAWISVDGFEERRLRWCVRKMKSELDKARLKEEERHGAENRALITSVQQLGVSLCATLQAEVSENRSVLNLNQAMLTEKKALAEQSLESMRRLYKLAELQAKKQVELVEHGRATREALEAFVNANAANISSMKESASAMAVSAGKVGDSAGDLQLAIRDFQGNVREVLDLLKNDLRSTIAGMNESFNVNLAAMSGSLVDATKNISQAVNSLAISVDQTMGQMKSSIDESMEIQRKASVEFEMNTKGLPQSLVGV